MSQYGKNAVSFTLLAALCLGGGGCALLGTTTADGNAKMEELEPYTGLKHAIGCVDFDNQAGWSGSWDLGNNLSIMLESALFDTGRFVLVERDKLKHVMAEQDLVASGRAAAAKEVAKTGLIRPARYIATGAVTSVQEGSEGGGGGIRIKGVSLGAGGSKASITLIAKLVDTTTSEIVSQKRIVGKAGRAGLKVGVNYGGVSTQAGAFRKTPLGDAAQDCLNQAAVFFARTMQEMPFEGSVIKVSGERIIINRGAEFGMAVGQELVMRQEGARLTCPDTGAILGKEPGKVLGRLKVVGIQPKFSFCEALEGEKNPPPGTVVSGS
jgi:curli biogenesis system outer membrane secretion channel CsgG